MRSLFFFFFCLTAIPTFAQPTATTEPINRYADGAYGTFGSFEDGSLAYALATDVNVREQPEPLAKVIHTLPIGTQVMVEKRLEKVYMQNGFEAPWHKVSFVAENGTRKTGYVWGGMLTQAIARSKQAEGTLFLLGVASANEKKMHLRLQVRAAREGKELTKMEFATAATFERGMAVAAVALGTVGFTGISDALLFEMQYEACGYVGAEHLIMWDGTHLYEGYEATRAADAGAFAESNELVFPNEKGGKPQAIVINNELMQTDEKGKEKTKKKTTVLKWNGKKFVK